VITLKLVDDVKGLESRHVILNGDGTYPETMLLEILCDKYNGRENIISYPRTGIKRHSGLSALNAIKTLITKGYRDFIFIVDGEHMNKDPRSLIERKLKAISIGFGDKIIPLKDAFLIRCSFRPYRFNLYCIISGPEVCLEEEVVRFIELKLNVRVSVPEGPKNASWKKALKKNIEHTIHRKDLKKQLEEANIRMLENSFPSICAVLNCIEEDFQSTNIN
jgi:hypothetical protein